MHKKAIHLIRNKDLKAGFADVGEVGILEGVHEILAIMKWCTDAYTEGFNLP